MAKEGEPDQTALFTSELLETTSTAPVEIIPATAIEEAPTEHEFPVPITEPAVIKREAPKATIRDVRAVRSLLYNRLLLERVLARIEKAEAIIVSYLLSRGDSNTQIGPYQVELDENNQITLTPTEDDGWQQMRIPEVNALSEPALEELREETDNFQLRI